MNGRECARLSNQANSERVLMRYKEALGRGHLHPFCVCVSVCLCVLTVCIKTFFQFQSDILLATVGIKCRFCHSISCLRKISWVCNVSPDRWCVANTVSSDAKGVPPVSGALAVDARCCF